MYRPAPRIEHRAAVDAYTAVTRRLTVETEVDWSSPDPAAEALIRIVGRYWEIAAERLNQALDKHFLAYLDLIGVDPVAPTAATVPITFTPVPQAPGGAVVPQGTQVAAGGETPAVFETIRPLTLTTARVRRVIGLDPATASVTDLSSIADAMRPDPVAAFGAGTPLAHEIWIGDADAFGLDALRLVTLHVDVEHAGPSAHPRSLEWLVLADTRGTRIVPVGDTTRGLAASGHVVFASPGPWPEQEAHGRSSRWLVCRLATPHMTTPSRITRLEVHTETTRRDLLLDEATGGAGDIDLSKDFFPFGVRPAFGSTLYLASAEAFGRPGTQVSLDIHLTNPYDAPEDPPIRRVHHEGHPRVHWEYWNGRRWADLAVTDGTKSFRVDGVVSFAVPDDAAGSSVQGREGRWIRARLASGHYGEDERWEPAGPDHAVAGLRHRPSTLAPPSIRSITATVTVTVRKRPDVVIVQDQLVRDDVSERVRSGRPFEAFTRPCGSERAVYVALAPPARAFLPAGAVPLYVCAESPVPAARTGTGQEPPAASWQGWNGREWHALDVHDDSDALTRDGPVELVVPEWARPRTDFVDEAASWWIRVVHRGGSRAWHPVLRGLLRNTVLATHGETHDREVLGSSYAAPSLSCRLLRTPILEGEVLQVLEADTASDIARLRRQLPPASLELERRASGGGALWVQWQPVRDFLASSPDDRHYVIDRQRGDVTFGDGRRGRIPPAGANNVRMRRYVTGGGASGNVPAGAITQLRTSVPYVDSAANPMASAGGVDAEPPPLILGRGATSLRHRGRAVTAEDHEDLARLASPRVRRALCVPLRDLSEPPGTRRRRPGVVSLVVLPHGPGPCPRPEAALLRAVSAFVDRHRNAATDLVVLGPEYVEVHVALAVSVSAGSDAAAVAAEVRREIDAFLHPVSGGPAGEGWPLGQLPERADVYAICGSVPGVAYVDALRIDHTEACEGALRAGDFLACPGHHEIEVRSIRHAGADVARRPAPAGA
jgi:hypothetical protein